jgi:mannose-6-phosphate isomerase-like protein (cupin superfamily)
MSYPLNLPEKETFAQRGLKGYRYPTINKEIEIYYVDVKKGHDTFIISKTITHMYYILEGNGYFVIDGQKYNVRSGMFLEVPPNIEYSYSGTMKVLLIMNPPWFEGNETITKKNPDITD